MTMRMAARVRAWAKAAFGRARVEREMEEELRAHIENRVADLMREGLPQDEARRRARLEFGGIEGVKEECRESRGIAWIESVAQDLRFGARMLRRSPGFALIAALTLALGIGATTAMFAIVNGVVLRPLAYRQSGQLYLIRSVVPQFEKLYPVLPADLRQFASFRKEARSFEQIAVATGLSVDFTGHGPARQISGARVSANLFDTLGVAPELGRTFRPEEDQPGRDHEVVLTNSFWRGEFEGDRSVVGKTIILDGTAYLIIGVLPPSFHFPGGDQLAPLTTFGANLAFFKPLGIDGSKTAPLGDFDYAAFGRLTAGISPSAALAQLNVIDAELAREGHEGVDLRARMIPLQEQIVGPVRQGMLLLLAAVGAVLLIVCVDLANLLLARGARRLREVAMRHTLGASRRRLLRQALTESALLGAIGGTLGVAVAEAAVRALVRLAPESIPRIGQVAVDWRVFCFAGLASLLTVMAFGALPAWRAAGAPSQEALKAGSVTATENRATRRLRSSLVGFEVALSTILLVLGGLLTSSLVRLLRTNVGFDRENVLAVDIQLPPHGYRQSSARKEFFDRVLAGVRAIAGVRSAAWVSKLPLEGQTQVDDLALPGEPTNGPITRLVNYRVSSPAYFETMGIPLLEGRDFTPEDLGRDVGIVSQSIAARLWPGKNAIGRQFIGGFGNARTVQVIGVAADVPASRLGETPVPIIYMPKSYGSGFDNGSAVVAASIVIRTKVPPESIAPAVRAAIADINPDVPITALRPVAQIVSQSVEARRFDMDLAIAFAACALILASLGIFGVLASSVEERRHELGIRLALGAQVSDLRGIVVKQGMRPALLGLAIGLGASLMVGRLVRSALFGVSAADPLTFALVASVVIAVALAACWVPARRATRVDPLTALRCE